LNAQRIVGELDRALGAQLGALRPLHFASPDEAADLPGHVRAGSALRRWQGRLAVIQDDVHALALIDAADATARPLLLPRGHAGRRRFGDDLGNKAHKLDLEAGFVLPDGRLVALGSGSTPVRERLVVVAPDGEVSLQNAATLYAGLRQALLPGSTDLNLEGATVQGPRLLLFLRGNTDPMTEESGDACLALEKAAFMAWLDGGATPLPQALTRFDLGRSPAGTRYGITDAAALADGRVALLAVAEASPDALRDGPVSGCRFGWWEADGRLRLTDIRDQDGSRTQLKLEGLEPATDAPGGDFLVVADVDDPHAPALLGLLHCSP
jgi:hypothetical protein